jgi:hypothetical protein
MNALLAHATTPSALALSADGATLFVTDSAASSLYALNVANPFAISLSWTTPVGSKPSGIAVSQFTNRLVVTNAADATISIFAVTPGIGASLIGTYVIPSAQTTPGIRALSPVFITPRNEVAVAGDVVAVADGYSSLWLFNTTNPATTPVGVYGGVRPVSLAFDEALDVVYAAGQSGVREIYLPTSAGWQFFDFPTTGLWSTALAPNASVMANTNAPGDSVFFFAPWGSPFDRNWQVGLGAGPTQTTFSLDSQTAYIANTGSAALSIVALADSFLQSSTTAAVVSTSAISAPLRTAYSQRRVVLRQPDVAKKLRMLGSCVACRSMTPLQASVKLPLASLVRG